MVHKPIILAWRLNNKSNPKNFISSKINHLHKVYINSFLNSNHQLEPSSSWGGKNTETMQIPQFPLINSSQE
jgi:hypothetical protein